MEAATKAAEAAAGMAKASEQEAAAKELEAIAINGAKEAGEIAGESNLQIHTATSGRYYVTFKTMSLITYTYAVHLQSLLRKLSK